MIALLAEPFAYSYMTNAIWVSALVGTVAAVLSCFLVLKGWSLMGDAISHAVLPGIVAAHVLALPMTLGAFLAGLACALATGYLGSRSRLKSDTVLAVVFSGMFAAGLLAFVKIDTGLHLTHVLFGNILGVTWRDMGETALIALPVTAITLALRRDLPLDAFDRVQARALGLRTRGYRVLLLALLSLAIVASLKAVGVILVIAMLIAPGATGFLLARRFDAMVALAVASAVTASVTGTILSFHLDLATGPMIVVVQAAFFALALGLGRLKRVAQA
jgi:manganese/iron transport system permease protein